MEEEKQVKRYKCCDIMPAMFSVFRPRLLAIMLLLPQVALAHSPIKGIGDFLNGMLHPVLVPAQVLIILALGLWYGQHQPNKLKGSVLLYLLATVTGLLIAGLLPPVSAEILSILLLVGATVLGLLVVSHLPLPAFLYSLFGLFCGLVVGLDSNPETLTGRAKLAALFGSGVGIYLLLLYSMALSESFSHKHWQNVAVRVLASWLSASAVMVLALNFSPKV